MKRYVPRTQTVNPDREYWAGGVFVKLWPTRTDLLEHELDALLRLAHRSVVQPVGMVTMVNGTGPVCGLCLEMVDGETVENWVWPLEEYQVYYVSLQLKAALAHCHSRGIAHGDVNVSNVILADVGWRPVLIDFEMWRPATPEAIAEDTARAAEVIAALSPHIIKPTC